MLHAWPAALCLDSALRAAEGPGRRGRAELVVHVAIEEARRISDVSGVKVHRMAGFGERVQWNTGPPRLRHDESVLDIAASARSDLDAVGVLADAVGGRRTTAARLLGRLEARTRIARRDWLEMVLGDVAATVRLGFGQVYERSCSTADKLGAVMDRLGWDEGARTCAACPPGVTQRGAAA